MDLRTDTAPPSDLALLSADALGVSGQSLRFYTVLEALSSAFHRRFAGAAESIRFPPLMSRRDLNRIGYFRNFPHFLGSVHCFCGDEAAHQVLVRGDDSTWTTLDQPTDLVLTPAACYPVYPILAARGPVPDDGHRIEVRSFCFRREPSREVTRLQSFQMQEIVFAGRAEQAQAAKAGWMREAVDWFDALCLAPALVDANDPFFGRAAPVMRKGQRTQGLKQELVVAINDDAPLTPCMSFNYHRDAFGQCVGIYDGDGKVAHTACAGIGLERTTLALFRWHGPEVSDWPKAVADLLDIR